MNGGQMYPKDPQHEVLLDRIAKLQSQLAVARGALECCETMIGHALYLGYCGEGSTKGAAEYALEKAREALAQMGEKP